MTIDSILNVVLQDRIHGKLTKTDAYEISLSTECGDEAVIYVYFTKMLADYIFYTRYVDDPSIEGAMMLINASKMEIDEILEDCCTFDIEYTDKDLSVIGKQIDNNSRKFNGLPVFD